MSALTQILSVSLPSEIIYVTGTVNGTAYTWTLVDTAWQATVDRAADEVYHVALTAVNSLGTTAEYAFTLYYGLLNLITDRTQADVDAVRALAAKGWAKMTDTEKAAWTAGLKGAYNAEDLNRVGAAAAYVAGRLEDAGYHTPVAPKQDWQMQDIPTPAQMQRYLADISTIRAALAVMPSTPDAPTSMSGLTYTNANDIEQILLDVDALITKLISAHYYSGEVYTGEV